MVYKYIDAEKQAKKGVFLLLGLVSLTTFGQYRIHTREDWTNKEVVLTRSASVNLSETTEKIAYKEVLVLVDRAKIEANMIKGFRAYSEGEELPIEGYIPAFLDATERYAIFRKYPYLLPAISILETSGGRKITRENNPLNWGARIQKAGKYKPQSWDQAIEDAITAIGGESTRGAKGSSRQRQAEYYKKFRETEDLKDFVNSFEPCNNNYYENLTRVISLFEGGDEV